jgi:hypothetical protein
MGFTTAFAPPERRQLHESLSGDKRASEDPMDAGKVRPVAGHPMAENELPRVHASMGAGQAQVRAVIHPPRRRVRNDPGLSLLDDHA